MNSIKIIRERNLTEGISLEDIKGGSMNGSGLCCISNESCNKNEKTENPILKEKTPVQP
ncbi:hypothetical protein [Porphyromonas sp.]|uniref:hypothetical protein n=1 Tax=Porphyromonas sp. TaxID=1924944 RepID=UPI0026DD1C8C|nr:hypothetical protein [Porphyromonas sp.]MDO4771731.1 hypothetical protein [Porphyromonas sp.]